jgi:hypothetical protein
MRASRPRRRCAARIGATIRCAHRDTPCIEWFAAAVTPSESMHGHPHGRSYVVLRSTSPGQQWRHRLAAPLPASASPAWRPATGTGRQAAPPGAARRRASNTVPAAAPHDEGHAPRSGTTHGSSFARWSRARRGRDCTRTRSGTSSPPGSTRLSERPRDRRLPRPRADLDDAGRVQVPRATGASAAAALDLFGTQSAR